MASLGSDGPANKHPPPVTSLRDLTIIEAWDPEANKPKYVTFYLVTPEEEVYFAQSTKNKRDLSLEEFGGVWRSFRAVALTLAPDDLDDTSAFIKRPGLNCYETMKGSDYIPKGLLEETLVMEQVSRKQHPNIIRYYGCRVKRGRITSIVLERLDMSLTQYAATPAFEQLNKVDVLKDLESAVDYLHSMGLAHNDINPDNIMIKDGKPVLIDFGSCQPVGNRLQSLGTPGWYEEIFYTSEKKHDRYSLTKLREWLKISE